MNRRERGTITLPLSLHTSFRTIANQGTAMRRPLTFALVALVLSGCGGHTGRAFGEGLLQVTDPEGYPQYKQPQYQEKMLDLEQEQQLRRQRQPIQCTSYGIGAQVYTNCY